MSKPEPKFSLAESVIARFPNCPSKNCENAIIVDRKYDQFRLIHDGVLQTCWGYKLAHIGHYWIDEKLLRPRPESATASYGELIASIKAIKPSKVKGEYMSSLVDFYLREIDQDANN